MASMAEHETTRTAKEIIKHRLATGSLCGDQQRIDISNLRFYAQMAREFQWQTDVIHWSVVEQTLNEVAQRTEAALAQKTRECEELLSHRLNNDPSKVEWHSPRTVGHLRMQLETIDPATPIAAVYFIKLTGSDVTIARSTGIQLSWECINNETNCIDQGNKKLPKSIAVWAHENDGFGPEVLAYLGRADELKTARGMEGTVIDLLNKNDALQAQVEQLQRQVAEMSKCEICNGDKVLDVPTCACNGELECSHPTETIDCPNCDGTGLASRARTK